MLYSIPGSSWLGQDPPPRRQEMENQEWALEGVKVKGGQTVFFKKVTAVDTAAQRLPGPGRVSPGSRAAPQGWLNRGIYLSFSLHRAAGGLLENGGKRHVNHITF